MSDKKFELSRRNALIGLGTVGLASAGAGVGTSAYFSDEESFEDNTLTAGELDLAVEADVYEYQGSANGGGQSFGGIVNGGDDVQQVLDDVKPGDYSWGRFCFSIVDNPGYIWAGGELTSNDENTVTEPEADSENENNSQSTTDINGDGELADAIQGCLFYATPDNYTPSDLGRPTDAGAPGDVILEGSLREILAALQTGVPLDGGDGDGRQAFAGDEEQSFDSDERCLGFWWEVPTDVGNEIQTDSLTFDLSFYAVQERHNDGSDNPFADVVLTDSDPSDGSFFTAQVSAGPTTVVSVELDDSVYTGWPNNPESYQLEVNIDSDTGDDGTLGENGTLGDAGNDDFRFGYAGPDADPGDVNGNSAGGYLRRNIGTGGNTNRVDVSGDDISGFTAIESSDQRTYTFVIDWDAVAADGDVPDLPSAPSEIVINEVFGTDGGGVFQDPAVQPTEASGTLQI